MPTLPYTSLHALSSHESTNSTSNTLEVICAWPVSGQYGPGSRVLYYVLIAACVFARKTEWLRNACLAAALLFPAVAAVHGIVLAAVHVDGAVDMDIFGAFQLCAIGILAAPVTVRVSRTYFYDPGRNAIFLWTGLLLAGLLSLTVEFLRIKTTRCRLDDAGNPMPTDPESFPYDAAPLCGLTCSVAEGGPVSPMRGGAVNNIYVIPVPDRLTFHTATLLAAACCIPAVLSLISMWNKIRKINWILRWGNGEIEDEKVDKEIEGTNGATILSMKGLNSVIRRLLSVVEVTVFGAAVLTILILGEMNFFSKPVRYQTEPIASIGQWAPLVGSGLAAFGSLYLLLSSDQPDRDANEKTLPHHCNCSAHDHTPIASPSPSSTPFATPAIRRSSSKDGRRSLAELEIAPQSSLNLTQTQTHHSRRTQSDFGGRRKVANVLTNIGNYIGTAAQDRFDDSEFKHGRAVDYPELPGEAYRNPKLIQTRREYNPLREETGRSRAPSFISNGPGEGSIRGVSPQSPRSIRQSSTQRPQLGILPGRTSTEEQIPMSSASVPIDQGRRGRRDTLEVPSPIHHAPARNGLPP
ncbi:uncharacterized protein RAG0_00111 [Rhynchosporium agropyri]|uniref:Uncharacterized protein n=1 Tax=Rhynchosporium agropyri TaxID=914238 RepID=A0A1E1JRV1_9HELO|nr:uncharacterized protein RAG0_00111 [Rhynchosporium agropyri]